MLQNHRPSCAVVSLVTYSKDLAVTDMYMSIDHVSSLFLSQQSVTGLVSPVGLCFVAVHMVSNVLSR